MTIDKELNQITNFRLRRIGKAATKPNVENIFLLYKDVTRFGRHSGNDNFIDSAELDCFISRWHSEIHRILHNSQIHYVLKDRSLNGTYVNNHRVQGNHVLQEGEVVCFGHTNGKNLKPGEYAPQTDSEFEFVFERAPLDVDSDVEFVQEEKRLCESPQAVHSTTGTNEPCATIELTVDQEVLSRTVPALSSSRSSASPGAFGTTDTSIRLADSSQTSSPHQDRVSPVLRDISNKSSSSNTAGLVPLDQIAASQSSLGRPPVSCNITVQMAQDKVFPPAESTVTRVEQVDAQSPSSDVSHGSKHGSSEDGAAKDIPIVTSSDPADVPTLSDFNQAAMNSTTQPRLDPGLVTLNPTTQPRLDPGQAAMNPTTQPRLDPGQSTKSVPNNAETKKRKHSGGSGGGRKPKGKRRQSSETTDDDERWHYAGDQCDAYDCSRPVGVKVSWVQCDDCDAWYHIQCAGCNYDKIKRKKAEFHCGCV